MKTEIPEALIPFQPSGGYFIWIKLPKGVVASQLVDIGKKYNVTFCSGSRCAASKSWKYTTHIDLNCYIRLSLSFYTTEEIMEGISALGAAIKEAASNKLF